MHKAIAREATESLTQALSIADGFELEPKILWTLVSVHAQQEEFEQAKTYVTLLKPLLAQVQRNGFNKKLLSHSSVCSWKPNCGRRHGPCLIIWTRKLWIRRYWHEFTLKWPVASPRKKHCPIWNKHWSLSKTTKG